MFEEIPSILPEWAVRSYIRWDKDIEYCFFRDGYKPFRLVDRSFRYGNVATDERFIIASIPTANDNIWKTYSNAKAVLDDLKQIAESRTLFSVDPKEMLGLPEIVSIKREGPLQKLTMIFGRDNDKMLDTARRLTPGAGYMFIFPEVGDRMQPHHPSKHADIIKDYIERFTICCIATHSEIMILYVLREVAKKRLTPEQVDVIYVCEDGKEVKLRLDTEGEFIDRWPEGFFEERMELLFYEE